MVRYGDKKVDNGGRGWYNILASENEVMLNVEGVQPMTINEQNGKVTVALEGRIDTNNAPQAEKEIFGAAEGVTCRL